MDATQVKLNGAMLDQMARPGISRTKRQKLREENIKAYIKSKSPNHLFTIADIIYAAGYTHERYQTGYSYINRLIKQGKITKLSKARLSKFTVGGSIVNKEVQEPSVVLDKDLREHEFVLKVEAKAKQFAWNNDSDSLREFIRSLK
jgi:hypothetical protein